MKCKSCGNISLSEVEICEKCGSKITREYNKSEELEILEQEALFLVHIYGKNKDFLKNLEYYIKLADFSTNNLKLLKERARFYYKKQKPTIEFWRKKR